MKLIRAFSRIPRTDVGSAIYMEAWSTRMDSLLAARPSELADFLSDAVIALAARRTEYVDAATSIEEILSLLRGSILDQPEYEIVVDGVRDRHRDVLAALSEHGPRPLAVERLATLAAESPWE